VRWGIPEEGIGAPTEATRPRYDLGSYDALITLASRGLKPRLSVPGPVNGANSDRAPKAEGRAA
jgi:hypothetical protein